MVISPWRLEGATLPQTQTFKATPLGLYTQRPGRREINKDWPLSWKCKRNEGHMTPIYHWPSSHSAPEPLLEVELPDVSPDQTLAKGLSYPEELGKPKYPLSLENRGCEDGMKQKTMPRAYSMQIYVNQI